MNHVDLARFEFDYDTTWTSFFLDADLNIYSRYGGRDERIADARMSRESLLHTMSEVLQAHSKIRLAPAVDLPRMLREETHPAPSKPTSPEDIPLLKENHQGCVHCHQIQEYRLLQSYQDGKFERRMLFGYPLPERLGLQLSRKSGHEVERLIPDSAAIEAGLKPEDIIRRVNGIPIRSEYDIRWALHRSKDDQPVQIVVDRQADDTKSLVELTLTPRGPWRQSELGWRKSLRSVPLQMGFLGYSLGRDAVQQLGFPEGKSLVKVISLRPPGLGKNLQLQKGDLITSVGGLTGFQTFEQFKSKVLELYRPGDTVEIEVLRDGKLLTLKGAMPDWFTEETSVP
ncbi:MAG: serine endoprotease [Planctomycetaceae bacterium]|nr:serine endoprotease [Planctomycetaceae bacterium]